MHLKVIPDDEAFHHVTQALGCDAAEVLFLDDNLASLSQRRHCYPPDYLSINSR